VDKHIFSFAPDSATIYQRLVDPGVDINYATRIIDAIPAEKEDAALLCIEPGTPMLRVRRRAYTLEGVPIEASDDRYVGTVANFTVTATRGKPAPATLMTNAPEANSPAQTMPD